MKRIEVQATGSQAPYGIGELVKDFPFSLAGLKKAYKLATSTYNHMTINLEEYDDGCGGDIMDLIDSCREQDGIAWNNVWSKINC